MKVEYLDPRFRPERSSVFWDKRSIVIYMIPPKAKGLSSPRGPSGLEKPQHLSPNP